MRNIPIVSALFIFVSSSLLSVQEYQSHFPPEEFKARREKVFDKIGNEAIAIIQGAPDPGGFVYPRQSNDSYYLCGVENSYAYLLLDGRTRKATLFLPSRGGARGDQVLSLDNPEAAKRLTGLDDVQGTDRMTILMGSSMRGEQQIRQIYTLFSPAEGQGQSRGELMSRNARLLADPWDGRVSREANLIALLIARNPRAEVRNLTPIVDELRTLKSPREIELLRWAGQLAALGIVEAMRSTRPGLYEYQLEAAARYIFALNGARLEGYRAILPSGVKVRPR